MTPPPTSAPQAERTGPAAVPTSCSTRSTPSRRTALADAGQDRRAQAVVAGRRRQGGDLLMGLLQQEDGRRRAATGERTIFFASDLHGSEVCFKKFVAAAKFYGADTLLLGGDISAKIVVPIVSTGPGRYARSSTAMRRSSTTRTVEDFEQRAANSGLYTERMEPDEYQHYVDHPACRGAVRPGDAPDRAALDRVRQDQARRQPGGHLQRAWQRRPDGRRRGAAHPRRRPGALRRRGDRRAGSRHGDAQHRLHERHPVGHAPRVQRGRDPRRT